MPTVPSYQQPEVGPVAPKFAPQSAAGADAEAFGSGVGRAQAGLGAALERVGDQFEQRSQQFQLQENEAEANQLTTDYLVRQSEITESFKQLQGRDPKAAMGKYTSDLKALREEMRGRTSNPEVARMFDRETTRQFGYAVMNGSSYAATQLRAYTNEQQRAVINTQVNAAADSANENVLKSQLGDLDKKIRGSQEWSGRSPEAIDAEVRTQQGKVYGKWVGDLALNDPTAARQFLNKNRKNIDGIVAQNLENVIDQQTVRVVSGQIANGSILGGVTDTQAQRVDYAMSVLTSKFGKAAAAGLIGNMNGAESSMDPLARAKRDGADGSDSEGIAQWNGTRSQELRKFAARIGGQPGDFKTQVAFVVWELENTHKDVGDALKATNDPVQAARIAAGRYEVAGGTVGGDPSGIPSLGKRVAESVRLNNGVVSPVTQLGTSPGQRGALEQEVKKSARAYATANGLSERLAADLETASVNKLDGLYSKQMQVLSDSQRSNRNSLVDFVNGGEDGKGGATSLDDITGPQAPSAIRDAWYGADAQLKQTIMDRIKKNNTARLTPSVPTPESVANRRRLEQMAIDDPDEFLKQDVTQFGAMTRDDIRWMTRKQSALMERGVRGDEAATAKRAVDNAVGVLRSNGLLDVHGLRKEDIDRGSPAMAQLRGALVQELDAFNVKNEGKTPGEKDLLEIGKRIIREEATSGWFGTSIGAGTKKVFDPAGAAKPIVEYDAIPDADRAELERVFRKNNVPVTRQNYRQYYQRILDRRAQAGN